MSNFFSQMRWIIMVEKDKKIWVEMLWSGKMDIYIIGMEWNERIG